MNCGCEGVVSVNVCWLSIDLAYITDVNIMLASVETIWAGYTHAEAHVPARLDAYPSTRISLPCSEVSWRTLFPCVQAIIYNFTCSCFWSLNHSTESTGVYFSTSLVWRMCVSRWIHGGNWLMTMFLIRGEILSRISRFYLWTLWLKTDKGWIGRATQCSWTTITSGKSFPNISE